MNLPRPLPPLLIVLCLALWLGGCGGSDSSSSTSDGTTSGGTTAEGKSGQGQQGGHGKGADGGDSSRGSAESPKAETGKPKEPEFEPQPHQDSGGGAARFETKGGDNSIQEYGSEPSGSEFAAAAEVLHAYLDARAIGAWKAACERLASRVSTELVRQLGAAQGDKEADCAAVLSGLTGAVPPSTLREAAEADIGALRVEGDSGFLLFRGAQSQNFFIPMAREDGGWKVAAIAASPLP